MVVAALGMSETVDTEQAFSLGGGVDAMLGSHASLGVAPPLVFGLQGEGASESAEQLDLRARLRAGKLVGSGVGGYVYGTIGASWIFLPDDFRSTAFVVVDAGYQHGAQSLSEEGIDIELSSRLFTVPAGIGSHV